MKHPRHGRRRHEPTGRLKPPPIQRLEELLGLPPVDAGLRERIEAERAARRAEHEAARLAHVERLRAARELAELRTRYGIERSVSIDPEAHSATIAPPCDGA